ncbi:transposase [Nocardiopsis metallicus]|uniref:Transposase-like protein n=1 Tax=Nocardiopsis metallicus TaxID=179819 RepID=A0A840W5S9_9ACTN|nr:transposase [Nocardiopsis metallicus]MBB5492329.1 transposase-like protein [Nocardiopsis metallicus]
MGRRGYPAQFRREVLDLVQSGRSVADVARDLDISTETIYAWRRQDRLDRGLAPGLISLDAHQATPAELAAYLRGQ